MENIGIKPFEFIQVKNNDCNIVDIMRFCGLPEEKIEQEVIFHTEGSPFMFEEHELANMDGSYILKDKEGFTVMAKDEFERLFYLIK